MKDQRRLESKTVGYTTSDCDRNDTDVSDCYDYKPSTPKMQKVSSDEVSCTPASKVTLITFVAYLTHSKHQTEPDQWYCQLLHTA